MLIQANPVTKPRAPSPGGISGDGVGEAGSAGGAFMRSVWAQWAQQSSRLQYGAAMAPV